MKPPLRLESLAYDGIRLDARRDFQAEADEQGEIQVTLDVGQNKKDERLWRVALTVRVGQREEAAAPKYELEITAVGVVRVDPEFPVDNMRKLVQINGASIVYTSLREFVMMLTSRGPWGSLMLPTTSFASSAEDERTGKETLRGAIPNLLRREGPKRIAEIESALRVSADQIRKVLQQLRDDGLVATSGRGRGTTYHIAEGAEDQRPGDPQ